MHVYHPVHVGKVLLIKFLNSGFLVLHMYVVIPYGSSTCKEFVLNTYIYISPST